MNVTQSVELVNFTPHRVTLFGTDGNFSLEPEPTTPRCDITRTSTGTVIFDGVTIPITESIIGEAPVLQDAVPGRILIVSRIVAESRPDRRDLVFPDDLTRDETGAVNGCRALAKVPSPDHH